MRVAVALLLCASCGWGPEFFDCGDVDENTARALATDREVLAVFNRMDFFCESRDEVVRDCRNETAEACTLWLGSSLARGRSFYSNEATEGLLPLLEHEMTHWDGPRRGDTCEQHPPQCDGEP
jgi:hypothetical protein